MWRSKIPLVIMLADRIIAGVFLIEHNVLTKLEILRILFDEIQGNTIPIVRAQSHGDYGNTIPHPEVGKLLRFWSFELIYSRNIYKNNRKSEQFLTKFFDHADKNRGRQTSLAPADREINFSRPYFLWLLSSPPPIWNRLREKQQCLKGWLNFTVYRVFRNSPDDFHKS